MTEPGTTTVTRRQLRLAERADRDALLAERADPGPVSPVLPSPAVAGPVLPSPATSAPVAATSPVAAPASETPAFPIPESRPGQHVVRRRRRARLMSAGTLVLAVTLVTGSVSHAHVQAARAAALHEQRVETATALRAENARQARVMDAAEVRLTSAAAAYAAATRSHALAVARDAIEAGGALMTTAAPVVSAQDLSSLDQAVAQLASLVESAPVPQVVMATATAELRPSTLPVGTAPVHDGTPQVSPVPGPTDTALTPSPEAASEAVPDPAPAPSAPAAPAFAAAEGPATDVSAAPRAVPLVVPAAAAPTVLPAAPLAGAPVAEQTPTTEPVPVPDVLDLALSAEIVAVTAQVNELSVQVQAVAAANIAAAETAARAAEEQAAASRRAAAARAHRVIVAKESPNGAIPTEVLCGVSFDSDALVRCDAASSLEDLNRAFTAEFGTRLAIDGSYRDFAAQVATKQARGALAAAAGTSNHGRALAVDLRGMGSVGQFDRTTYRWMKANAAQFGWYHPTYMEPGGTGPMEPWHWEFGKL